MTTNMNRQNRWKCYGTLVEQTWNTINAFTLFSVVIIDFHNIDCDASVFATLVFVSDEYSISVFLEGMCS